MERIKVGIVGCGFIGNAHYLGYKNNPQAEVVAVCDMISSSAEEFAKRHGIKKWYNKVEQLLEKEDIDAVSVCTPHHTHAEVVVTVAEAGKHILVEKPLSTTTADADTMIEATKKAKVKFMVAFINRFTPPFTEAKQIIDEGAIGEITMIRSTRWGWIPWSDWYIDPAKGGGILRDRFCYGVDHARWLTGSEVEEVFAYGATIVHKDKAKKFGKGFIDNAKILMKMKNGILASAEESYSCKFGYYDKLEVIGSEGLVIADPFKHDLVTLWTTKSSNPDASFFNGLPYTPGWNWPDMAHFPLKEKAFGSFSYQAKHFIDCIINDWKPLVTGEDGKAAVQVVNAAEESYSKGIPVKLNT